MNTQAPAGGQGDDSDDEIDLLELLRTLWRGKVIIAACALVFALIGAYYAMGVAVPKYAATASLALQMRQQPMMGDIESVISGVSSDDQSMNTEVEVITSHDLIAELVREMNLTDDPEFNAELRPEPVISLSAVKGAVRSLMPASEEAAAQESGNSEFENTIDAVQDAVTASIQRDTFIFHIRVVTWDADKSVRIANTLADLYLQDQIDNKLEATEGAVDWLSERVVNMEADIAEREDRLAELQSQSDFVSEEGLAALNMQIRDTRERISQLNQDLETARARLDGIDQAVADGDVSELLSEADDATLRRLASDASSDADLLAEGSTFMSRLERVRQQISSDIDRLTSRESSLTDSLSRLETRMDEQSEEMARVQQFSRELDATRVLYQNLLTRLKETSVQQGLQQSDARVLSRAARGTLVEPKTSRIVALSMILGLMAGCGGVLLYDYTRSGFRTADDLENTTGVSVIGQIPRMPFRKRQGLLGYLRDKPTSASAEAVRNLRTSILLSDIDHPPQVIMSTSSIPGEGKTTQSLSLAQNLVGLGKKVLIVEGDIRRRTFTEYFENDTDAGVLSVLSGEKALADVVVRPPELGADVLMGEKSSVNAADVFASDRFKDFLNDLRGQYDFVIVDTPPVLVVPDARLIGQYCDAIIYSVRWDSTSKRQVIDGIRQLSSVHLKVNGLVLSQVDPKGMKRYGYGGRYGAYASYGSGYYDS